MTHSADASRVDASDRNDNGVHKPTLEAKADTRRIHVFLSEDVIRRLKVRAALSDRNQSEVIQDLLDKHLPRYELE